MNPTDRQNIFKNKWIQIGICILAIMILGALFAPLMRSFRYDEIHLQQKNLSPSFVFWFGSDELGRDIFTRVWWGIRLSLAIAICATLIDLFIGVLWGAIAAFFGGKLEQIMMRICDILQSIPYVLMAILFSMILGRGFFSMIVAIAITGWITMARIVRGYLKKIRNLPFMLAAESMGASKRRQLFSHFIPQSFPTVAIILALNIPSAIFTEAFLSFLGLGIAPPHASLGVMIHDAISAITIYPWRAFIPGGILSLSLLGFYFIGEGLRQILDPKWISEL